MLRKIQLLLLLLFGALCFCAAAFGAPPDLNESEWSLTVGSTLLDGIEHPDHATPKLQFAPEPGRFPALLKRTLRNPDVPVTDLVDDELLIRLPGTVAPASTAKNGGFAVLNGLQHPVRAGPIDMHASF